MRFLKVLKDINTRYDIIRQGEIICFSKYFRWIVVISDGKQKTRHIYSTDKIKLHLILEGKLRFLTDKELNKIKPHLRKEHFNIDL